ncbi:MFS transporter [Kitasatospora sp. NPDC058965]|uniref:MFS transporter n=1 Tax=Kitasatospora sp. NPDC058965 TaxID=3346682 RepID=UPI00367C4F9F
MGVFAGRLAQAMYPLALLLILQRRFSGVSAAGAVVSAFTFAVAICGPMWGRLIDRRGPAVLAVASAAAPISIGTLALAARHGSTVELWVVTLLAGALQPPVSSVLRSLISTTFGDAEVRTAAYSVDSISTEVCFILGPAVVGLCASAASPAAALLIGAALTPLGASVFLAGAQGSLQSSGQQPNGDSASASDTPTVSRRPVWVICALAFVQFLAVGMVEVGAVARAAELGSAATAGGLLAVWALGSVGGGLVQSLAGWRASMRTQYAVLSLSCAAGFAVLAVAPDFLVLAPLMFLAGLAVAPTAALAAGLVSQNVPTAWRTEAFTWMNSASAVGGSAGYLAAGTVAQQLGARAVLLAAATLPLIAAIGAKALPAGSRPAAEATETRPH